MVTSFQFLKGLRCRGHAFYCLYGHDIHYFENTTALKGLTFVGIKFRGFRQNLNIKSQRKMCSSSYLTIFTLINLHILKKYVQVNQCNTVLNLCLPRTVFRFTNTRNVLIISKWSIRDIKSRQKYQNFADVLICKIQSLQSLIPLKQF